MKTIVKEFGEYSAELKPSLLQGRPVVVEVNFEGLRMKNAAILGEYAAEPAPKKQKPEEDRLGAIFYRKYMTY